ncbi:MAG: BACON domain-containing carbohydrate-binding protein [Paludibacter sp.]|nr:BACON domain-containing carbohydrate-binding protein [Paludibacter sp.]
MIKIQKKTIFFRLLLGLLIFGTFSCVEEDLGSFKPKDPNMVFGESDTIFVGKDVANYKVMLTANLPWRVKSDADWVTVNTQRGEESDSVAFSVAKNPTTSVRTARLTAWITQEYENIIIIKQEAGDPLPDVATMLYVKVDGSTINDGLTWETATTLDNALALAETNDQIHIAAGTYTPTVVATGGSDSNPGDLTFEIKKNISLIGGYPADASSGAQVDPSVNTTTLSGSMNGQFAYHVIMVTAPVEEGRKIVFENINITGGKSAASGTANLNINGLNYPRLNGGAGVIARSVVEFKNCRIHENKADYHTPGLYIFSTAHVTFISCSIDKNTGTSASAANGGAIWNDGSTVYLINSAVSFNGNSGVGGGIYAFNASVPSKTYMFNTTIDNNYAAHKAGYYGRENSIGLMVNGTVFGNNSTHATNSGAGICLYANTTTVRFDLISSTVTGNVSNGSADASGGIRVNDANCTLSIYNSIISGNLGGGNVGDIYAPAAVNYNKSYTIISGLVYGGSGNEVNGQTFNPATMLAPFANNGGVGYTCLLTGSGNPAETFGMTSAQLSILGLNFDPVISDDITTFDQLGKTRVGKTSIGACAK